MTHATLLGAISGAMLLVGPATAQTGTLRSGAIVGGPPSNAPMTSAPAAPGSTRMHMVPTPVESKKSTKTGGNAGGG